MGNIQKTVDQEIELMVQLARREAPTAKTPEELWPAVEKVLQDARAPEVLVRQARRALFAKGIDLGRADEKR